MNEGFCSGWSVKPNSSQVDGLEQFLVLFLKEKNLRTLASYRRLGKEVGPFLAALDHWQSQILIL